MTDWADEAFDEIGKAIRSGWDMDVEIKKILRKAKADGMREAATLIGKMGDEAKIESLATFLLGTSKLLHDHASKLHSTE